MAGATRWLVALGLLMAATVTPATATAGPAWPPARFTTTVEQADNSSSFTWAQGGLGGGGSSIVDKPGDPLTFYVYGFAPADGTATAHLRIELFNNTGSEIRFPGGLRVIVLLRSGWQTGHGFLWRPDVTALAPNTGVQATTTAGLRGFGTYSVSAFTVAQFPQP